MGNVHGATLIKLSGRTTWIMKVIFKKKSVGDSKID